MNMFSKVLRNILCVICGLAILGSAIAKEINLGVLAPRGSLKSLKEWSELGKYISAETGYKVNIIPLNPVQTMVAVKAGKVDFLLTNPVLAVGVSVKYQYTPLVTRIKKSGSQFGGVIISAINSQIRSANDLKGKNVLAFKFRRSAAAYVFQVKHLKDKGIDPHTDFKSFRQAKKQDDIVFAVSRGVVDAGFVKTGLLESMVKEGKIKLDQFYIIDQVKDDFKQVHSTRLYPEWTLMVKPGNDATVIAKLKAVLLKLKPDHIAAKKAKIKGFIEAVSLEGMKETLKDLKISPYNS